MGYAFSVFAVDLARLKEVRAGKNHGLMVAIRKKYPQRLVENSQWFAKEIAAGAPTLDQALERIIAGKIPRAEHGFQYGYAVELLCIHLGTRIDQESLSWFDEQLDPLLQRARKASTGELLGRGKLPFAIPAAKDFPQIGALDAKGIATLETALADIAPLAAEKSSAALIIEEVRGWITRASRKKRGIVWFVY